MSGYASFPPYGTLGVPFVIFQNCWYNYLSGEFPVDGYSKVLNHEIGHDLNLRHAWDSAADNDFCGDTPDHVGCWSLSTSPPCNDPNNISNNVMDYNAWQTAFTPCQIGRAQYQVINGIIAQNYVEKDYCEIVDPDLMIDDAGENIYWQCRRFMKGNVIVKTGTTLTIQCEVGMPNDAKIIVERGARLVIDGGTITSNCGELWQGIEVYGAGNLVAHPTRNEIIYGTHPMTSGSHGVVFIHNGATIEYARNGITTSRYDDYYNTAYYGGVVLAVGSNFINNKRSVEFMAYNYNNIIGSDDNMCEFNNCTFDVNDDYICSEAFQYHVTMWNVHGVDYLGCKFKNTKPCAWANERGIYSIDATYKVANIPCPLPPDPCPAGLPIASSFEGNFSRGIHAANTVYLPRDIEVNGVDFLQSSRGILLSGVKNSLIINNNFEVLDASSFNCYGIYLEGCENYQVENNDFTTWGAYDENAPYNAGIYAANNSNAVTEIYRNFFVELEAGIRVQTNNSKLQLKCNTTSQIIRRHDFYVTNTGLLGTQGKCLTGGGWSDEDKMRAPAGNIFSHDCYGTEGDFKIFSGHPELKYKHHTGTPYTPQCYTTGTTFITLYDCGENPAESEIDPCPSQLPGGGGGGFMMAGGGSGAAMEAELENLKIAIENLEAAFNAEGIDAATSEDLAYLQEEKEMLLEDLVNVYVQEGNAEAAIAVLENEDDVSWAKQRIVEVHTTARNYEQAKEALPAVSTGDVAGADFTALYSVLLAMYSDGRNILTLKEEEIKSLQNVAGKQSLSGVAAENILEFVTGEDYEEVFDPEEEDEKYRLAANETFVSIYPNPAGNELFIELTNKSAGEDYTFELYSLTGQRMLKNTLTNDVNVINLKNLPYGFYLVKVRETGFLLTTEKVIKE